jgi:predicted transposase/invertase (TIGR01784 family)
MEADYSIMRSITTYSGEFLMSPRNDFAFRLLFGDPNNSDILLDLLNAILPDDHFQSVVCTDPHLLIPDTKKECILDIKALSDSGVHVDIEMQALNLKSMEKRNLFYWAKMYLDQLNRGRSYHELKRTIVISILDYMLMPVEDVHTCFQAYDKTHDILMSDVFEIHFLELPKVHRWRVPYEGTDLLSWLIFLQASTEEEIIMASEGKPAIQKAYHTLQIMSLDEETRRLYEAREMFLHDQATRMQEAKEEGLEEGIKKGREEVAKNMLSLGIDDELVIKATGLDQSIINSLKQSLSLPTQ